MKLTEVFNENKGLYFYDKNTFNVFSLEEKSANNVFKLKCLKNNEEVYVTENDANEDKYEFSVANFLAIYEYSKIFDKYFKLVNGIDKFNYIAKECILNTNPNDLKYKYIISEDKTPFKTFDDLLRQMFNEDNKEKVEICVPLSQTTEDNLLFMNFTITKANEPNDDNKFWHYLISIENKSTDNIDILLANFKLMTSFLNYACKSRAFYTGLLETLYVDHIDTMNMSTMEDISDYIKYNNYDYGIILLANLGFLKFDKMEKESELPSFFTNDGNELILNRKDLPRLNDNNDIILPDYIYDKEVPVFLVDTLYFHLYMDLVISKTNM